MNETQTVTGTISNNGTYVPNSTIVWKPITTDGVNGYQQISNGTIVPWASGGSRVTSWPIGGAEAVVPKKPRKPRTKKVLPAHEQEMKDAEAKWKKILDGQK